MRAAKLHPLRVAIVPDTMSLSPGCIVPAIEPESAPTLAPWVWPTGRAASATR